MKVKLQYIADREAELPILEATQFKQGDIVLSLYPKNKPPTNLHLRWQGPSVVIAPYFICR